MTSKVEPNCVSRKLSGLLAIALTFFALACLSAPAVGQDAETSNLIEAWNQTATRAEEALESGRASSAAFETLRAELAEQRVQAEKIIRGGDVLVRSLKAQLETLGSRPGKDEFEPEQYAEPRRELSHALAIAEAPVISARRAFARANLLIEEIDALVRARKASDLLQRTESPLLPSSWNAAANELRHFAENIVVDTRQQRLLRGAQGTYLQQHVRPATLVALVALLVPIGLGHFVLMRLERRILGPLHSVRFLLQVAAVHILRLAVSVIAALMLVTAYVLLLLGPTTAQNLTGGVTGAIFIFVLANWVGNILFAPRQPAMRLVPLSTRLARASYWLSIAFAMALSLERIADAVTADFAFSPAGQSVIYGVVILIGAIVLAGLARLLLAAAAEVKARAPDHHPDSPFGSGSLQTLARIIQALALVAFVGGAMGYVPLAREGLSPTMLTMTVFGLAYIVHRTAMVALGIVLGEDAAASSLMSVAIGFLLLLVCLPLLALVWGARANDISEAWRLMAGGIDLGGVRLSPRVVLILAATFFTGLFLTRWLQRIMDLAVLPKTRIDRGGRNAIRTGLGYIGIILSALVAISTAGLDLSNLAIIAGALSVGVGFGMQAIVSNFVSGIILLIERPIKEGDWIEVADYSGIVRKISVRSTRLETFDRHDVIIPNSELIAGSVKNMTLSSQSGRLIVPVGIAYRSDLEKAKQIMLEAASAHPGVLSNPAPQVLFIGLGASSLDFELRCFLTDIASVLTTRSDLLYAIYAALEREGIEIPFTQRDINLRNIGELISALRQVKSAPSTQI